MLLIARSGGHLERATTTSSAESESRQLSVVVVGSEEFFSGSCRNITHVLEDTSLQNFMLSAR